MKSFIDQIKLLSYGESDYFIVDSNLKVLDSVVENASILSGSFNPIHHGHRKLLDYCSKKYDKNKYYEISLLNVDKAEIVSDDLSARLKKFSEDEKIIITKSSKFVEKATLFPNSHFVIGYDTGLRILDESYLNIDESLDDLFSTIDEKKCKFIVAGRVNVTGKEFDNLKLDNLSSKYKNLFELIEEKDFREDVSSTEKRRQNN
ncbi:MAG: hypothetical protein VX552_03230 [Chloroflexota bacterium]|nr:hypothetical protein [Chloroflexota bacterium]|tara:strand:- start:149 stop:760 length:612 start_codon:yes stop_codon:yes gene_type:complete